MNRRLVSISFGVAIVLSSFAGTKAQTAPPPKPPEPPSVPTVIEVAPLGVDDKQLADQYVEAIEQLENTIDDYVIYFERIEPARLKKYNLSFDRFAKGLESGKYSQEPSLLERDLDSFIARLRDHEASLRDATDPTDRKLLNLFRGLRRDLTVVLDMVEDVVSQKYRQQDFQEQIEFYVAQQLRNNKVKISRLEQEAFARQWEMAIKQYQKMIEDLSSESRLKALASLKDLKVLKDLNFADSIASLSELSLEQQKQVLKALEQVDVKLTEDNEPVIVFTDKNPKYPTAPQVIVRGQHKTSKPSRPEDARSFTGTLGISSSQMPIYITHPRGELIVSGWNNSTVSAELYVEINAPSDKDRDQFLETVELKMGQDKDGYYAETVFPRLTNTNTSVAKSILKIKVPRENRVICNHSFGSVNVEKLDNAALIKGSNSKITASEIQGSLRIENTLGEVTAERIEGTLQITNSSGEVFISDCDGRARISNASGLISVNDSKGSFKIVNTGPIDVIDHEGDIEIENYNGLVKVKNVTGDLSAYNTLQPMSVENVTGSVTLENRNADIKVYRVGEDLQVTNSHANIEAGALRYEFDLKNDHGNILLNVSAGPENSSRVQTNSGQIILNVPGSSDLTLDAVAEDGSIDSDFPAETKDDRGIKAARITIGGGANLVKLKAVHGSIRIKRQ